MLKQLEPVMPSLLGISLSEENIVSEGHPAVLDGLYGFVKNRYPNLAVYQWYTPNTANPNTLENVWVRADGWIIDSYTLCADTYRDYYVFHPPSAYGLDTASYDRRVTWGNNPYEKLLRKYLITGKPLIATLWATSADPPGWMDPKNTKAPCRMWDYSLQDLQVALHQTFDVPTALYWVDQGGNATFPMTTTDTTLNEITQWVIGKAHQLAAAPPSDVNAPARDSWSTTWDDLLVKDASGPGYTFNETFHTSKFLDETNGSGFTNLVWNGDDLVFREVASRNIQKATIRWKLTGPTGGESFTRLAVSLKTTVPLLSSGKATLRVAANANGPWQELLSICVPQLSLPLLTCDQQSSFQFPAAYRVFWIELDLTGHVAREGDPVIRADDVRISAQ